MRRTAVLTIMASVAALAGCATDDMAGESGAAIRSAEATLLSAAGEPRGAVTVTETAGGLRYSIAATGLPAGPHGAHVHMIGRCDAPDFTTAGGHWNPTNREHGRENPQGQHAGDLPNLIIGTDGRGSLEITTPGTLAGSGAALLDADSAAFVIHASADDLRSDPSGNSGARIACGVFQPG